MAAPALAAAAPARPHARPHGQGGLGRPRTDIQRGHTGAAVAGGGRFAALPPAKASPAGIVAMSPHDAAQRFYARPRPNEFSPARSCSICPARLPFAGCFGLSGALAGQKVLHIGLVAWRDAVVLRYDGLFTCSGFL